MNKQGIGYRLEGERFVIEGFDRAPAFSSFLPGIAGKLGIPLWCYTNNRGQGIASLGVHHKGNSILEFNPAVVAYENTALKGYRTFLKLNGAFVEPFSPLASAKRRMEIEFNALTVVEENEAGFTLTARYFLLPNAPLGALVRRVRLRNTGGKAFSLEMLDGVPRLLPFGVQTGQYKEMSNLVRSWTELANTESQAPLYRLRASTEDSAEVKEVSGANFYLALMGGEHQKTIYDPDLVFGWDSALMQPRGFMENGLEALMGAPQVFENKIPCGFTAITAELEPGQELAFDSLLGHAPGEALFQQQLKAFQAPGYLDKKDREARELLKPMLDEVWCETAHPAFDSYIQQCHLDNLLRGGYPEVLEEGGGKVVHLFSRKHGDPERDYNFFTTAGEYYSQGNGNFRDVCQNRRNDVLLKPAVGGSTVRTFLSLVQMDGYNPLEIRPATFQVAKENLEKAKALLSGRKDADALLDFLQKPFTPGALCRRLDPRSEENAESLEALVSGLLKLCEQNIEAGFGEGYWSDHFDYLLDLVDSYLKVFPDQAEALLFEQEDCRFYDSGVFVRPRKDTQVLAGKGVRHYGALAHDNEKEALPGFTKGQTNWLKDKQGQDLTTSLFGKLVCLAANKTALLDPAGCGLEMEGGKPGWCDAMNGLPGLMGSGMPETLELRRLLDRMLELLPLEGSLALPLELAGFAEQLALIPEDDPFARWDRAASLREAFREQTRLRASGEKISLPYEVIRSWLTAYLHRMEAAVTKALKLGGGLMPTYFTYEATAFEPQKQADGSPRLAPYGLPAVTVTAVEQRVLPLFLEGPARFLAAGREDEKEALKNLAARMKDSGVYDRELKMYKTSEALDGLSHEHGRIRAFTPGWLERESVFLHMEYKYFYGLLLSGQHEAFFEAAGDALIPFLNPERYGRSVLENSSFIASTKNPDPAARGRGFVSRLTGSTAEMLSIWLHLMLGPKPFEVVNGQLAFSPRPQLPANYFTQEDTVRFRLFGDCTVTYHNPQRKDCFGPDAAQVTGITVTMKDGGTLEVKGGSLPVPAALALREGRVSSLKITLG